MVLEACRLAGLPVAVVMAGGYAQPIDETVLVQAETVRILAGYARVSKGARSCGEAQ